MNFDKALEALKEGKRIQRINWNDKGLFAFMQIPSVIDMEIVPKMQSLPQLVKDEFIRRYNFDSIEFPCIRYSNQLAIVDTNNLICGWSPSVSDILATDWIILE